MKEVKLNTFSTNQYTQQVQETMNKFDSHNRNNLDRTVQSNSFTIKLGLKFYD